MKNFVQPGHVLTLVAPYARSSGEGALVGAIFGVATVDVANGIEAEFQTDGVVDLAKTSAQAWTQGQPIYWDNGNKVADSDPEIGVRIGVATEAADNPSATGSVKIGGGGLGGNAASGEGPQDAIANLTAGTNINAVSPNGVLIDSSATNPSDAQYNDLAKELMTKINAILAALRATGIIVP